MINKTKNKMLQITFPKELYENLENLVVAYEKNGIKTNKSEILAQAFQDYLHLLIACAPKVTEDKKEEK